MQVLPEDIGWMWGSAAFQGHGRERHLTEVPIGVGTVKHRQVADGTTVLLEQVVAVRFTCERHERAAAHLQLRTARLVAGLPVPGCREPLQLQLFLRAAFASAPPKPKRTAPEPSAAFHSRGALVDALLPSLHIGIRNLQVVVDASYSVRPRRHAQLRDGVPDVVAAFLQAVVPRRFREAVDAAGLERERGRFALAIDVLRDALQGMRKLHIVGVVFDL
mmetsp:Transcript_28462/g.78407  ORF Transcript_28462/g.78407 Transcript_28462/m.78407 type:complete len:219 (-) Transcript_28462:1195-1851(-)